jgi:Domain of unknown function (DUF4136)
MGARPHSSVSPARRLAVVAAAVLVAGLRVDAGKTDLRVEYDKKFAFAGLRTWTWHPDGPGDVKLAVSSYDDAKRVAARVDPVIVPAVEREMTARGFARTPDQADLFVHYYVLVTVNMSAQEQGQFLPSVPQWGVPPFVPSTTALSVFPVGTLIVDITSTSAREIVWRGAAERKVDMERPDTERRKVLEKAIRDLLQKFPPRR